MGDDWFIMRTSGRFTLPLAATLALDGFEVWTPARMQAIRIPRSNVRRDIRLPMLPSFLFARQQHLSDLLALAKAPAKPRANIPEDDTHGPSHRDFSLFRYQDSIPLIHDRHLDHLREAERKAIRKKDRPRNSFQKGQSVRVGNGAFEGMIGKIERCKSGYAVVIFDDWSRPVQIPTFLLAEDEANSRPVARAA